VGIAKALYVGTSANVGSTTDSSSISTGAIVTAGGVGIAKNLYVGGTLNVTGSTTFTNPIINNIKMGYTTTATAAGTTTLTVASNYRQFFTGSTTQTIVLPVTSTLVTGMAYEIENNSTGLLTVNSSGGNLVGTVPAGVCAHAVCIGTTLTTAADWDWDYISTTTITGTGANVLATSPTITTPTIDVITSAAATALTLQSAGTTALTLSTSQAATFASTIADSVAILRPLVSGTAVASTSGTSIDFTSIPSWVKRITVMFSGVSTNGTSHILVQIGTGGVATTSGYSSASSFVNITSSVAGGITSTAGFIVYMGSATYISGGNFTITNISGNIWTFAGIIANLTTTSYTGQSAGSGSLSGTLNLVRITTVNGTDTFDAGSVNILYE
jgi:hypothetical protein